MWSDNEVRYNISINDGSKNSHAGIFVWCDEAYRSEPLRNTRVCGNKIIRLSWRGGYTLKRGIRKDYVLMEISFV